MSRMKKVPRTKAMEITLDDLMAIDEIAIEAKKLPMASRAPIDAPRIHGIISPFPYPAHPLIRA